MKTARRLALDSLIKSQLTGAYSNLEADAVLKKHSLVPEERTLYYKLYLGTIEKKITIDYLLSQFSSVPLNRLEPEILCLLELGAFQILYLDRVPDRAACFEAVEMAKSIRPEAARLVNAVLRRVTSEKDNIDRILAVGGKKELALRYGYPRRMVSHWINAYGKERCEEIMKAQNTPASLSLRVNTLKIGVDEYERLLQSQKIAYHPSLLCRHGITLEANYPLQELPGYREGLFFVQDPAAQYAIERLGAKKNEKILDLAAAPGGKSFAAAMDMEGEGEILSMELHENRLPLIRSGAERLGIRIIQACQNDSTRQDPLHKGAFDRVICDVPCSGWGVIAKKPDIRHKPKESGEELNGIQSAMLETAANALKKGGVLLYSTCTLNPSENEQITDRFLENHPEFRRVGDAVTIFPVGGEHDGFFCDLLEKLL